MLRAVLLVFLIVLLAGPASAQNDNNELLLKANPQLLLSNPSEYLGSLNEKQLVKLYYDQCLQSNPSPDLKNYNEWQCACTASKMEGMDHKSLVNFFNTKTRTNFERGRVMYLAYIPCLETTMRNFMQDTCKKDPKLCSCIAEDTGHYIYKNGANIIPGFVRGMYVTADAPANPLASLFSNQIFLDESENIEWQCNYRLN